MQHSRGGRHVPVVQNRLPAAGDAVDQHRIVMVPGVAGFVVRRRRVEAVFIRAAPVWLSLQLGAMAGRAMRDIEVAPGLLFGSNGMSDGDCGNRH